MPGTITITGASGFIGSRVALHAARSLPGHRLRLVAHRKPLGPPASAMVETLPGDLADPGSLRGLCSDSDVLIHCASQIGGPPELCEAVNAHGTEALMAEARRAGVARIVYLSTAAVYGRGPFRGARPQDLPTAPLSATSRSRLVAEQAVLDAGGIVLRPHVVYGTGDRWVAPGLVKLMRALDATVDGWPALLSLVEVDDLARALVGAAVAPGHALSARVYHANHPRPVAVPVLLRTLAEVCGLAWPAEDIGYDQACERLRAQGRSSHDLDMLVTDHSFDSAPLWADLACDPGPGFADRFRPHAPWYERSLAVA